MLNPMCFKDYITSLVNIPSFKALTEKTIKGQSQPYID